MTSSPLPRPPQGFTWRELALAMGGVLLCLAGLRGLLDLPGRDLVMHTPLLYQLHLLVVRVGKHGWFASRPHLLSDGLMQLAFTCLLALVP